MFEEKATFIRIYNIKLFPQIFSQRCGPRGTGINQHIY